MKKFYNKFGIYNKEKTSSNIYIEGNFDLINLNLHLHEITQNKTLEPENVSFIEKEFNGLKTSYIKTEQMVIDRWISMVACWERYQSSLCVVSCGTALTIDSIDHEGNHLGGYILPGVDLMQQSLIKNTENINFNINHCPSIDYASDTKTAVNNGAFLSLVSSIDRVVNKLKFELGGVPKCVIYGGNAPLMKPLLEQKFEYEPNLVLHGLLITHNTLNID